MMFVQIGSSDTNMIEQHLCFILINCVKYDARSSSSLLPHGVSGDGVIQIDSVGAVHLYNAYWSEEIFLAQHHS
jgi:hypothetical protein